MAKKPYPEGFTPNTTANKLAHVKWSKEDIKQATNEKGVIVDESVTFKEYGDKVRSIYNKFSILSKPLKILSIDEQIPSGLLVGNREQTNVSYAFSAFVNQANRLYYSLRNIEIGIERTNGIVMDTEYPFFTMYRTCWETQLLGSQTEPIHKLPLIVYCRVRVLTLQHTLSSDYIQIALRCEIPSDFPIVYPLYLRVSTEKDLWSENRMTGDVSIRKIELVHGAKQ